MGRQGKISSVAQWRERQEERSVRNEEKIRAIHHSVKNIEEHLAKLNDKVMKHEVGLTRIYTWGAAGLLLMPILASFIIKMIGGTE